ncbi:MAG: nitrate reductase cytochrome c-type subunit [Sulfurimonas sp.]|nr:nitrate reductase cytochrome c-type subunit [Sulfurimonas sp.]
MKAMSKITIGLVAAALLMVGCVGESAKASSKTGASNIVTEASLGLRKTDLYTEDSTTASKTEYRTAQAMGSTKIKRAFQDAPPMIPHDTTGMLPIKIGDNRCLSCHLPKVASGVGATPIPVSHFTNFRPHNIIKNGMFKKEVDNYKNEVSIKETTHLQGARFNCTQCHAPQSQGNLAVENTFEAVYLQKDGAEKSRWSGTSLTESLDTIKGGANYITPEDIANANSPAGASIWTHH